jgi:two-component system sensor histidine kinase UhpB
MAKELNILIVEDVPQDAAAIEEELREGGIRFHARRLETRAQFLKELASFEPDIVLSDFTLPTFDALEALRLLHQHRPGVPFILVTGTRSEEVAVECIREGADDYILKASLKRLPSSIRNALAKQAAEREQARTEEALRRSEEQYRLIAEKTQDLISLLDAQGRFIYASPSFKAALGWEPVELAGADPLELLHPDDREVFRETWRQALVHKAGRTAEFRLQHRNGEWRVFESGGDWIFDEKGQPQRLVVVSRDMTRRKESEEALRELPRLIREAQEAERCRVARDLHDSVNQMLASVKFRIQSLEDRLATHDESLCSETAKAQLLLDKAMQEVRRISRNLRPSELDDLGLAAAVRSLCEDFRERTGLAVEVALTNLPATLPDELESNLYRVIQEALNNAEKHSRASRLDLRLAREGAQIHVMIRDNGRGFDPDQLQSRNGRAAGMGLVDMRERTEFVGGVCSFKSGPGAGTEISIRIPLTSQQSREKRKTLDKVVSGG